MKHVLIAVLALFMIAFSVAQDKPSGKVHGYVFGDYFYKIGGNDQQVTASQFSKTAKDFQAFQFRRLYLYYDHTFNEKFSSQFLLEGNDKTFESGGKHTVFVKTAYLQWKDFASIGDLAFGLVPTPTWSWAGSEKTWNYRAVEKTIMDFRGLGSASDIGVSLRGKFDSEGKVSYVAMIGNGAGQRPENNKYKKYYASVIAKPMKDFVIDGYFDYEPAALEKSKSTIKGVAAYATKTLTIGAEYFQQTQSKAGTARADIVPSGLSLFAWTQLTDELNAFARFDMFDPDSKITNAGYKENFIVAGLDYAAHANVRIIPNLWVNTFSAKNSGTPEKDADLVARITFFFIFK